MSERVGTRSLATLRRHPRIVAVVQARMGSTRLPGKVLADIAGRPMLDWVLKRVVRTASIWEVVVATTTLPEDDVAVRPCAGPRCRRDPRRRVGLAEQVRHCRPDNRGGHGRTGDFGLPVHRSRARQRVVETLVEAAGRVDYVSNVIEPRTFPRGLNVEAVTRDALLEADRLDADPRTCEHVTPFVRESGRFRVEPVTNDADLSSVRWTVDTTADLMVVRTWPSTSPVPTTMPWRVVLAAWRAHPKWREVNADVEQKTVRRTSS